MAPNIIKTYLDIKLINYVWDVHVEHWWKNSKNTYINAELYHAHGLEDYIKDSNSPPYWPIE